VRRCGRRACPERSTVGDDLTPGGPFTDVDANGLTHRCFADTTSDPVHGGHHPGSNPIAESAGHRQLADTPVGPVTVCPEPDRQQHSTRLGLSDSDPATDGHAEFGSGKCLRSRNAGPLVRFSSRSELDDIDAPVGCLTGRLVPRDFDAEHAHRLAHWVGSRVAERLGDGKPEVNTDLDADAHARPGYRHVRSLSVVVAARSRSAWRDRTPGGVGASEGQRGMITGAA
jgi:hypothetical protein